MIGLFLNQIVLQRHIKYLCRVRLTVAKTLLEFTAHFPDALVYARGSSPARTRLYQMEVLANLNEIGKILEVFGFINGHWLPFERNVNYEAFLVWRK